MDKKLIKQPFILILYGPTGVGKTDIALSISAHIPSEIINMDVGQFYTPLSIGTAKPNWKNEPTPHHLFDIINEQKNYTVIEFRHKVRTKIKEILSRGKLPILVGGSGFYVRSLLFPPHEELADIPEVNFLNDCSWDDLYAIDPQRALQIDKNDTYRIMRALTIWHTTGKLPTSFVPHYNPLADFLFLYVIRDTPELNMRINERIHTMIQQGWVTEAKRLMATPWEYFIRKKNLIGYSEIFDFLKGKQNEEAHNYMVEMIGNKTRQYAKRQRTFWRKLEREIKKQESFTEKSIGCIESLNLTSTDLQLYINELLKRLSFIGKKNE